jgi:hypothetical protein
MWLHSSTNRFKKKQFLLVKMKCLQKSQKLFGGIFMERKVRDTENLFSINFVIFK